MTLGGLILWLLGTVALVAMGSKGGVLLLLSRAIDNMRAAIRCAELSMAAARWEWARQWGECKRWVGQNR